MLQRQDDLGQVEAGRVLHEDALALQVHEELAAGEVLQDQVELAARLEGVHQVHDERVLWRVGAALVTAPGTLDSQHTAVSHGVSLNRPT